MQLNLVLVDEEDRRYFKQQEIILWRKADKTRKPFQASLQQQYKQMQNPNVQFSNSDQSITGSARNLGATGDLENNSRLEDGNGPLEAPNEEGTKRYARSPLEQSSSSEQPTPDKEFQSVINSQENRTMSPLTSDNPIEEQLPSPPASTPRINDEAPTAKAAAAGPAEEAEAEVVEEPLLTPPSLTAATLPVLEEVSGKKKEKESSSKTPIALTEDN